MHRKLCAESMFYVCFREHLYSSDAPDFIHSRSTNRHWPTCTSVLWIKSSSVNVHGVRPSTPFKSAQQRPNCYWLTPQRSTFVHGLGSNSEDLKQVNSGIAFLVLCRLIVHLRKFWAFLIHMNFGKLIFSNISTTRTNYASHWGGDL